jgi:hypothetical protein
MKYRQWQLMKALAVSKENHSEKDELSKLNPIYPHWMLQFTYMDRTSVENFF